MKNVNSIESGLLKRIEVNPKIFGGKPIIRGVRIAVEHVLGMLASGETPDTILKEYTLLKPDDIRACLLFATRTLEGEQIHERISLASK